MRTTLAGASAGPTKAAPNVVLIVLDDAGYSDLGCFGSEIATPNIDQLAAEGVRYANFHATPLCSPSRAALLTGCNSHSVGMGFLSDVDTGHPHSRGTLSPAAVTLAEMLRDHAYSTFAVGKWHLAPLAHTSAAGPFDAWPLGRGFERFYGFLGGLTDQFEPELVADNSYVDPPRRAGYHLSEDLVDHAIAFVRDQASVVPEKPFFLYLAFGAVHAPHQVDRAYVERYLEVFEKGWDRTREDRLARQIAMGLLPSGTRLTERNAGVLLWSDLSPAERRHAIALQAAFAGFLEHADKQVGRLISFVREIGQIDDTIVLVLSDNGADGAGGAHGSVNINRVYHSRPVDPAAELEELDRAGVRTNGIYPMGWAMAGNTPFRRYKAYVDAGGVNVPLIVRWPTAIRDAGAVRHQFGHVVDIVPTILDLVGIDPPADYRGRRRLPIHGSSLRPTLVEASASDPRDTQYYELFGHRAIWHRGWRAVGFHRPGTPYADDEWQLFHVIEDASEATDLAAAYPEKLRELQDLWWVEAGRYGVLPLDDRPFKTRFDIVSPDSPAQRRRFVYYAGQSVLPRYCYPQPGGASFTITAELDGTIAPVNGAIASLGNGRGGYILFVHDGCPIFEYSYFGQRFQLVADRRLPAGPSVVSFEFTGAGDGLGRGELRMDGRPAGSLTFDVPLGSFSTEGLRVGRAASPYVTAIVSEDRSLDLSPAVVRRVVFELESTAPVEILSDPEQLPPQ